MPMSFRSVALVVMALLAGCGGGGPAPQDSAASPSVARAAGPGCAYEHVFVTVERLVLNRGPSRVETVLPQRKRIDLLVADRGLLQSLGVAPLAPGHYSDVRLILSADGGSDGGIPANAVQASGGPLTALKTPGAQHSGLKLQVDFDVAEGQAADLMLDTDPCALVKQPPGAAGNSTLDPTVAAHPVNVTMPARGEFRVSVSDRNADPAVAGLPDGGYLVAWSAGGDYTMRSDVYAQRYLANGSPLGTVTAVTAAPGSQGGPQIAVLADGGYVIAFGGADTPRGGSVGLQRYAADGSPAPTMPPEVQGWQASGQTVLGLDDGSFVFAWSSAPVGRYDFDVYAQRFAADGSRLGGSSRVNTSAEGGQGSPAMGRAGRGYVIVWNSQGQGDTGVDVRAQWYRADGTASGGEVRVNTTAAGNQTAPAVATLANGDVLIIWVSDGANGEQTVVASQRYTAAGAPVGSQQVLVDSPGTISWYRSVAGLNDGGSVLAWGSCRQYGDDCHVDAQRFDTRGAAVGARTTVDTAPNARTPAVAALTDGGYVLVWSFGQPGLPYTTDIYGEQFDAQGLAR